MSNSDVRICFIGDSFVNGTADPTCLGWTGRICSSAIQVGHHITYYNLGIRRNTSQDIAERWDAECQKRLLTDSDNRVVFSFGANDTMFEGGQQRVDTATTLHLAVQVLTDAKERYSCLWVGPPPVADADHNARIGLLCEAFQTLSGDVGVPYLPIFTSLLQSQTWMGEVIAGDGAHPQAAGYAELARLVQWWPEWWFKEREIDHV